jgi:NAD(P)-dependent dehydrogenase (short-subunit alcohol dehydrogenase family)
MDECKAKYVNGKSRPPMTRRVGVFGTDPGNIGEAIAFRLESNEGWDVTAMGNRDQCNLLNRGAHVYGQFDSVVFANGFSRLDWIEDMPADAIYQTVDDNMTASIIGAQEFVKQTIDHPWKKQIVFIGSMAYQARLNASATYCAAKAGLTHFARCLAWELAPKNYDVFIVHPSNTLGTPMTEETIAGVQRYRGISREEAEAYWGAVLPRDQWLTPEDIAETVAFLLSGKASYLSGANIDMAGGQR